MPAFLPFVLIIPSSFHDRSRHPRACQELNIHEELVAGCFLTGHPDIKEPVGGATLGFGEERVFLFGTGWGPLGSVSYESIRWVAVEGHEDILKRFDESRLMLLGHKVLAFRAREYAGGPYVVVEWEDAERRRHDGIFCFEGLAADSRARSLRDAILHHAVHHRRASGARSQERFAGLLEAFEVRRCEHCGKVHRPPAPGKEKSAA
jgi:hypothetical protein